MPHPRKARRTPALLLGVAALSATALVATMLGTPAQASSPAASATASVAKPSQKSGQAVKVTDRAKRAKLALVNAQKALGPVVGETAGRPDATLALRRLWKLKDSLSATDRAAAEKLAARPDKADAAQLAGAVIHYNAAELTTYTIQDAVNTLSYVTDGYANSGYRRPLSDGTIGGDGRIDIYLDQLEPGLYGYCTTDQEKYQGKSRAVWAFCVLDADFVGFPRTPVENLQVTAAHEYFHATQFAYDFLEDPWLLEATAAWVEDEMYPAVNDNYQYLADSPITKPGKSMDKFGGFFHYGVWSFFRFLSEKYPTKVGLLPSIVLDIWEAADSSKGPRKDKYSTEAIDKVLKKVGRSSLAEEFSLYSVATRSTHTTFVEGAALNYPTKPISGAVALGPSKKKKTFRDKLDHLTSSTFQFVPSGTAADSQLKVRLKFGSKKQGSRAVVQVFGPAGVISTKLMKVSARGVAKKKFDFAAGAVTAVEVTLVNTSQRYKKCYVRDTPYSCSGVPVDKNVKGIVNAKAT